jgi:site-specific DNA-cytosine methylase
MEEERTLLARGEETTTPQAVRASNFRVPGVHVHQENTQFSTDQFMECQLQMHEVAQKLVSTPLFSFQNLKLSTRNIIAILEDTLNTTSGPLPIPEPHATEVLPSDIQLIQNKHMELLGPVHLVISSWECQGFSAAGFGEGLSDTRSGLFMDMVRVITWAQSISPTLGYVIENTPSQLN